MDTTRAISAPRSILQFPWVGGGGECLKPKCASLGPLGTWVPALAFQVPVLTVSILLLIFSLTLFKAAHRLKKEENPAICDSMDEPGGARHRGTNTT